MTGRLQYMYRASVEIALTIFHPFVFRLSLSAVERLSVYTALVEYCCQGAAIQPIVKPSKGTVVSCLRINMKSKLLLCFDHCIFRSKSTRNRSSA